MDARIRKSDADKRNKGIAERLQPGFPLGIVFENDGERCEGGRDVTGRKRVVVWNSLVIFNLVRKENPPAIDASRNKRAFTARNVLERLNDDAARENRLDDLTAGAQGAFIVCKVAERAERGSESELRFAVADVHTEIAQVFDEPPALVPLVAPIVHGLVGPNRERRQAGDGADHGQALFAKISSPEHCPIAGDAFKHRIPFQLGVPLRHTLELRIIGFDFG